MENIRNRVDVRLVNNRKKTPKLSPEGNFKQFTLFDENLIAIHMKRTKLVFNKLVHCRMSILDISRALMYEFHYNYIKKKYGDRAKLLFTDTDSLAYEIATENFNKDMREDVGDKFVTSSPPPPNPARHFTILHYFSFSCYSGQLSTSSKILTPII